MRHIAGDYRSFQQDSAPAHLVCEIVELLRRESVDLWPPSSHVTSIVWTAAFARHGLSYRNVFIRSEWWTWMNWGSVWLKLAQEYSRASLIKRLISG